MWQAMPIASPPAVRISAATVSQTSCLRPEMTTRAPARAISSAIARPMPRVLPVTTATFPVRSKSPMRASAVHIAAMLHTQPVAGNCRRVRASRLGGTAMTMKLFTYYRSQASFRVRIALNIKGLNREDTFLHLEHGDQYEAGYKRLNPQAVVPTLFDDDHKLFQSLAILEYLEETHPNPPLLPRDL